MSTCWVWVHILLSTLLLASPQSFSMPVTSFPPLHISIVSPLPIFSCSLKVFANHPALPLWPLTCTCWLKVFPPPPPLALLPSPLPSTTDMHKHTPAANNRSLIQGGHTADPAGPLSRTGIWTWAAAKQRPQCSWEFVKSTPVWAFICCFNSDLISQNKDIIQRVS